MDSSQPEPSGGLPLHPEPYPIVRPALLRFEHVAFRIHQHQQVVPARGQRQGQPTILAGTHGEPGQSQRGGTIAETHVGEVAAAVARPQLTDGAIAGLAFPQAGATASVAMTA